MQSDKNLELNSIENQIMELENKRYDIKTEIVNQAKKKGWFSFLQTQFESSSQRTPQYLSFHRIFKQQFIKLLKENFPISRIEISKPNHFDVSGFFELENKNIYYFSIGDLRWNKEHMLIRTAKDFKDYTGGCNNFLNLEDWQRFLIELRSVVNA